MSCPADSGSPPLLIGSGFISFPCLYGVAKYEGADGGKSCLLLDILKDKFLVLLHNFQSQVMSWRIICLHH